MKNITQKALSLLVGFAALSVLVPYVALSGAPALGATGDDVVFEGAGFGHGRGMSQYGAQARAVEGQKRETILFAYYTDEPRTVVAELGVGLTSALRNVFVNVRWDSVGTILTVSPGGGSGTSMILSRIGSAAAESIELSAGDTVEITDETDEDGAPNGCRADLVVGKTSVTWTTGSCDFDISLYSGDGLPEEIVTTSDCRGSNCTFGYGEALHLVDNGSSQRCNSSGCHYDYQGGVVWEGFDIVVEASLDDYTRGIAEVPFSWDEAALQAQAVAARSYAASWVATTAQEEQRCFCDLVNDTTRQVFAGWIGEKEEWQRWDAAAVATNGLVLTHPLAPDDGFIRAEYSSSNAGVTAQGYDNSLNPLPYMSPTPDPFSLTSVNPYRSWTVTVPAVAFELALWSGSKVLDHVEIETASASGKVSVVRFTATDGTSVTRTSGSVVSIIRSSAICIRAGEQLCGSSASPLPSYFFDVQPQVQAFTDIDASTHKADIEYLAALGIALACTAGPENFCPNDRMRREDLAAFMVRALDLPPTTTDYFHDDDGLPFEDDINALAAAGITRGCNPPTNDRFCPDSTVTRGQTAAFIVRAWNLTDPGAGDRFADDDLSVFEGDIDRLAQAGITLGCNPPDNTNYCPLRLLSRAEMSSFLARALRKL